MFVLFKAADTALTAIRVTNWVIEKVIRPARRVRNQKQEPLYTVTLHMDLTEFELEKLKQSEIWKIVERGQRTAEFCDTAQNH